ncbi:hypothetical protein V6Z11_1Z107400 [Gossypium hirsutum]
MHTVQISVADGSSPFIQTCYRTPYWSSVFAKFFLIKVFQG